eukprot:Nitzschia sp. Nitz4//scaffold61_size107673//59284//60684//NITZ4_004240-RA/size107673-processed-gene-0.189-mRNA-1//-1//CDS//3329555725//2612//frame0
MKFSLLSCIIGMMTLPFPTKGAEQTMFAFKHSVREGSMSSQGLEVLSSLELQGVEDDWDTYVEVSPGSTNRFKVYFYYELFDDASTIEALSIRANTIGLAKSQQRVLYYIRNFKTSQWTYIGDNAAASSWVWSDATFVPLMSNGEYADYFNSNNEFQIQIRSNNDNDVFNIDYLAVDVVTTDDDDDTDDNEEGNEETDAPGGTEEGNTGDGSSSIWSPKASDKLTWQWQLQGTLDTSYNVDMYDVDLFDTNAAAIQSLKDQGRAVVCYFSAGTYEGWRSDWAEHFNFITGDSYSGSEKPFAGNMAEWDERWLDIRELDLLDGIMSSRLQLAADKGCDAVEPDNMDAYTNPSETGLTLTYNDQLVYNRWLADKAHSYGLSVGLKNDVDQLDDLVDYYDWALNEECFYYSECDGYVDSFLAKNKAVFGVEYNLATSAFCQQANSMSMSWLKKRLNLSAYREGCEDYSG